MNIEITDARIVLKSGHGQYNIVIEMLVDGKEFIKKFHTTDSELFDESREDDFDNDRLINAVGGIEMIKDYID